MASTSPTASVKTVTSVWRILADRILDVKTFPVHTVALASLASKTTTESAEISTSVSHSRAEVLDQSVPTQ